MINNLRKCFSDFRYGSIPGKDPNILKEWVRLDELRNAKVLSEMHIASGDIEQYIEHYIKLGSYMSDGVHMFVLYDEVVNAIEELGF